MGRRTPLDDVEYLASSGYRVEVLEALADRAHTRSELRDLTGISQPTLGRILGGFEERGWIERTGREYRISGLGSMLAEDFAGLLETVETVQDLAEIRGQLPVEGMDFDVRLLREARITVPRPPDVLAHFRRGEENVPCALVETENGTIRAWVTRTLDECRDRATEVTVEDLPR